jgi:hypothetical protein
VIYKVKHVCNEALHKYKEIPFIRLARALKELKAYCWFCSFLKKKFMLDKGTWVTRLDGKGSIATVFWVLTNIPGTICGHLDVGHPCESDLAWKAFCLCCLLMSNRFQSICSV